MCDHCGCRAYRPIADLTAEHEQILALAEPLAAATHHHRRVDEAGRQRLLALLHTHVAKEEGGLYPLLIAEMGEESDAFDHLEAEHRELFETLGNDSFDHLALYALQRHIEEEEEVLFSAALFYFDGDTWDDLEAAHRATLVQQQPDSAAAALRPNVTGSSAGAQHAAAPPSPTISLVS